MYLCIYVSLSLFLSLFIFMYIYMYIYYIYIYVHIYLYIYIHKCMYIYIYIYIYTQVHMHIYNYKQINSLVSLEQLLLSRQPRKNQISVWVDICILRLRMHTTSSQQLSLNQQSGETENLGFAASSSFFITLKPRVEFYKSLCAFNTIPPRNHCTFLQRNCSYIDIRWAAREHGQSVRTGSWTGPPRGGKGFEGWNQLCIRGKGVRTRSSHREQTQREQERGARDTHAREVDRDRATLVGLGQANFNRDRI